MTGAQILDRLAELEGWIDPPDAMSPKWRVHEAGQGLPAGLRDAIRAHWADVQTEALRRQSEALKAAQIAAIKHLPSNPTPADRERAIDAGCVALLREVLARGVGVPDLPADQLIDIDSPGAEQGALFGDSPV